MYRSPGPSGLPQLQLSATIALIVELIFYPSQDCSLLLKLEAQICKLCVANKTGLRRIRAWWSKSFWSSGGITYIGRDEKMGTKWKKLTLGEKPEAIAIWCASCCSRISFRFHISTARETKSIKTWHIKCRDTPQYPENPCDSQLRIVYVLANKVGVHK